MANPAIARGLQGPQSKTGKAVRLRSFTAAAEIFVGDPVTIGATGAVTRLADAEPSTAVPDAVAAEYAAASGTILCYVDLGDLTFEIEHDGTPASTNVVGQVFQFHTNAGDSTTRVSGTQLDTSSAGGASSQVRVVDMVSRPDNDNSLANPVNRVEFVKWGGAPAAS